MSDVLFEPTLVFFCHVHYCRTDLAQSGWLEYDGQVETILTSEQFDRLSILNLFRHGTLLQLNGNVKSLFLVKIGVLSLNLLPFLYSKRMACGESETPPTSTEETLALRVSYRGGLSSAPSSLALPLTTSAHQDKPSSIFPVLSSLELLRIGYLVIEDRWLVSMTDWYLLMITAPVARWHSVSMRVMLFAVKYDGTQDCCNIDQRPLLCQISDPRLANCRP